MASPKATHKMLPGELVVARAYKAQQILYYTVGPDFPCLKVSGALTCTNYCFRFEPDAIHKPEKLGKYGNKQLAYSHHVPLGSVKELYMITSGRKKPLDGHTTLPKKIAEVEILCKDLKRLMFTVKHCAKNEASSILNALARHTHPSSVSLLFAFDYARATQDKRQASECDSSPLFLNSRDWQRELARLGVAGDQWRISEANRDFLICDSLSPYVVVPATINDSSLDYLASLHRGNRLPVWCWSHPHTGVSLTRGSSPTIDDQSEAPDPNYMYAVAMARHIDHQAENRKAMTYNVTKECGTLADIRTAFNRAQELCHADSSPDLSELDKRWLSGMESWLTMVRSCLLLARKVARCVCIHRTPVFLHENEGRDLSSVISSLAQLMVDPYFRSLSGLETLIQKEWVAMGYPFTSRHGLIYQAAESISEEEPCFEAPVFLLFLDCVWQLSLQFPSAFEFSESYLLHLHDLVHSCLFGMFVFNSPKARLQASLHLRHSQFFGLDEGLDTLDYYEGLVASPWNHWRETFTKEEKEHCLNPFYYIFGSSEARYDLHTSDPLPTSHQFGDIFKDKMPNLAVGGSYGLYSSQCPTKDLHTTSNEKDYYQMGLLLPETSLCSVQPWLGFFMRYNPEFQDILMERKEILKREGKLVKDVRRLKDTLNELELSVGSPTSDLTSFIGEILAVREMEQRLQNKLSIEANVPYRPRLSAIVIPFEGEEEQRVRSTNMNRVTQSLPCPVKSLAEFTETLYSFSEEETAPTQLRKTTVSLSSSPSPSPGPYGTGSGRSPITKTRLRVTRTESTEPTSSYWSGSSSMGFGHIPLVPNKILIKDHCLSVEEDEEEGQGEREGEGEGEGEAGKGEVEDSVETYEISNL